MAVLAFAGPASAQVSSATQDQYSPSNERFAGSTGGDPSDPSDPSDTVGSLPFTGLDLGLMGGAAVTLLAGGVLLRRRGNPGEEA